MKNTRFTPILLALASFAALSISFRSPSAAQPFLQNASVREGVRQVRVTGAGTDADPTKARDAAIQDALRRAVEEGLGVLVDARTLTENYQLVKDEVLTRSRGLVRSYRILSEKRDEDVITVQIDAEVALGPLEAEVENLADRLKLGNDPRIALLLEESESAEMAESQLTDTLMEKGFTVQDVSVAARAKMRETVALAMDGQNVSAARRALIPVADILILGRVITREEDRVEIGGSLYYAASARCEFRAVHADTGTLIARFTASSPRQISANGQDTATEKAVQKAASLWLEQSLGKLVRSGVDPMRTIALTFYRVNDPTVTAAVEHLRSLRNVRGIRIRDREQNLTLVEIEWSGPVADLLGKMEARKALNLRAVAHTQNTARLTEIRGNTTVPAKLSRQHLLQSSAGTAP